MTKTGNRYLVVHGHFYQPPRENPWLESVETQDSAAPFHDWNSRITSECYARNGASRIVNTRNQILRIVNNYAQMSFNFGPTLLSWLEEHAPLAYRTILDADQLSAQRFSGHGSAMAQVYNHIIMPLASRRDKELQVRWGIADFRHRFGRDPEGMWLAETAADTETLEVLAENGILFTVLAPNQCAAVRPLGRSNRAPEPASADQSLPPEKPWEQDLDTRRPYRVNLPSGRSLTIFFYDGARSRAIAFERLLDSGEGFAQRMASGFSGPSPAEPELVHVATDGESYGHHHRFGEMALSYAFQYTEAEQLATITNYGEYLAHFPPAWEARIAERTSWSCAHGVERWRSDCGCNGGRAGWNQRWRAPLRAALDGLRDAAAPLAATLGTQLFKDWSGACDRYITIILNRERAHTFLAAEQARPLRDSEQVQAFQLLELVREMQLMYTSCGWFFDDISGIETLQIIAYAARALELAAGLFGAEGAALEPAFLALLAEAHSNVDAEGTGADIYRTHAAALRVGLVEVTAHFAISSIFRSYPEHARLFAFNVNTLAHEVQNSGRGRLLTGEAEIRSTLTQERAQLFYSVLHFGDQNIAAGVKLANGTGAAGHDRFSEDAQAAMLRADLPMVIRLFDREFGGAAYTIRSLFRDEQRRVMQLILNTTVEEVEESLLRLYENHSSLLQFLNQTEVLRPSALALAADFAINILVRRALGSEPVDAAQLKTALELASRDGIELDQQQLSYTADERMRAAMALLAAQPQNREALENALATAQAVALLPFPADIWQAQNIWHTLFVDARSASGVEAENRELFQALGRALGISAELMHSREAPAQAVHP